MAAERYIQICRASEADVILSRRNRIIVYSIITFLSLFLPFLFLINDMRNYHNRLQFCADCRSYQIDKYFLLLFTIVAGVITIFFYIKANRQLRALKMTKNSARNSTLTQAFALICTTWMFCFIPSVIYGIWAPHLSEYLHKYICDIYARNCNPVICLKVDYQFSVASDFFDLLTRLYGLVNSIMLIVIVRAFQRPLISLCRGVRKCGQFLLEIS
ncbi:uncharacterized protein LOC142340269 [Convolutriloba macropyga]|uniref:uncharacterized protein LOC142340269 n=1 Tax=Convolutriloba macropyga TaxID=536237 RepID=UPI003F51CF18